MSRNTRRDRELHEWQGKAEREGRSPYPRNLTREFIGHFLLGGTFLQEQTSDRIQLLGILSYHRLNFSNRNGYVICLDATIKLVDDCDS